MIVTIIGKRGTGKSTLALSLAREMNRRIVIWDSNNQFKNATYHVTELERLDELMQDDDLWETPGGFEIAFVPHHGVKEPQFDAFASVMWQYISDVRDSGAASFAIIIDEANQLQSPNYINQWLDDFIKRTPSREKGNYNPIDVVIIAHRPQDITGDIWDNSDYVYIFFMYGRNAIAAIDKQWGDEMAERVKGLRVPKTGGRDVLKVDTTTGQALLIDDPELWYSGIERTNPENNA